MTNKQWEPPKTVKLDVAKAFARHRLNPEQVPPGYDPWALMGEPHKADYIDAARAALLVSPLPECVKDMRSLVDLVEYLNGQIKATEGAWPALEELSGNDLIEFHEIKARLAKLEGKEPADETC